MCSEQVIDKLEKKIINFFWNWKNFIIFFQKVIIFQKICVKFFPFQSSLNMHVVVMLYVYRAVENDWWVERYFLKSYDASLTFLSSIFDRRNHNKRSMYRKLSELFFTVKIYIIENMAGHQWHVLRRLWLLTTHICHYFYFKCVAEATVLMNYCE